MTKLPHFNARLLACVLALPAALHAAENPFQTNPPKDSAESVGTGVVLTQVVPKG